MKTNSNNRLLVCFLKSENEDITIRKITQILYPSISQFNLDQIFMSKYKNLIELLNQSYPNISKENTSILLKSFLKQHFHTKEIINIFYSINQMILHILYYNTLINNDTYKSRNFSNNSIDSYYNHSNNHKYINLMNHKNKRRTILIDDMSIYIT